MTVTVADADADPLPVQVRVKVVVVVRAPVDPLPFRVLPSPAETVGEMLQLVAFAEVHVRVE